MLNVIRINVNGETPNGVKHLTAEGEKVVNMFIHNTTSVHCHNHFHNYILFDTVNRKIIIYEM